MAKDIEKIICKINGTMALEGMPLSKEDKQRIRNIAEGKISVSQEIEKLNLKYLNKKSGKN